MNECEQTTNGHNQIRKAEKARLREARTGSVICPPGNSIDEWALPMELREKLRKLLKQ